jgi:hypothetical protein
LSGMIEFKPEIVNSNPKTVLNLYRINIVNHI